VLFEGREVVPVGELRDVHEAGALAHFFVEGDEGIYWAGTLRDGLFARPLLLLPTTIRDGMDWGVAGEEKAPEFRVVVGRREASEADPSGWTVRATYVNRFGGSGDLTLSLGESVGQLARLAVNAGGDCIVPHSPQAAPAASDRRRATLQALNGGTPFLENTLAERVSVVDDPHGSPGRLQLATRSWGLTWSLVAGYDIYSDSWCHLLEGDTLVPGDPKTRCPEAGGVIVTSERTEIVPSVGDRGKPYLACTHSIGYGGVTVTECFSGLPVIFARPDGVFEAGEVTIYDELFFGPYLPDGDPWKVDREVRTVHPFSTWRGGRGGRYAMVHQEGDGGLMLGMPGVGQREEIAHYSAAREQVGFAPGVLRSGLLSTWSGPEGRFAFQHTNWGRVERLELAEDGLRVHHLADVDLPEGHFVVGAFARDGKLAVLTQGGFVGLDAPVNYEVGEDVRAVDLGDVYA
jgi:hypothetical protein